MSSLMPYWLIGVSSVVKPLMTILLLGPPAGSIANSEQDGLCSSEEDSHQDGSVQEEGTPPPSALAIVKRELTGVVFLAMAVLGTVSLGYQCFLVVAGASAMWEAAAQMLLILANAPGVVSMLNIVALVGLYDGDDGKSVARAVMGRDSPLMKMVELKESDLDAKPFLSMVKVLLAFCLIVPFGGWFGSLDREAVGRIPKASQRALAYFLWVVYKPLYQIVLLTVLPALGAYVWLWAPALLVAYFVAILLEMATLDFILPLRASILGQPWSRPGRKSKMSGAWFGYFLIPIFFALLIPVFASMSIRLVSGGGYWGSIVQTWNDRHALDYGESLWGSLETSLEPALRRAGALLTLAQSTL